VSGHVLELRKLTKDYPGHRALDSVSLEVAKGAFFTIVGPSGCGKTTLLRLVAGFEEPTTGEVRLNGALMNGRRPYERNVSTVFQSYALFPHMTVRGNVEFGLRRQGIKDIGPRVKKVLETLGIEGKEDRYPAQLSGGERQRVALARSVVLEPEVLLLDEPLSALDPNRRKQVRAELKTLQRSVGITFVFITHDQEEALSLSDSVAVLNNGRLEQVGSPAEVYLQPASAFVASFLGTVNWIDGVGVRPEATRIARVPPDAAPSVPAVISGASFLGNSIHVEVRLATGAIVVAELSRLAAAYQPGEAVHVWWEPTEELRFS
jgi:ABC-type Fe3+/spermidine/putrescine transport system ATPase subunit